MAFRVFGVVFCIVSNLFAGDFLQSIGDLDKALAELTHIFRDVSEKKFFDDLDHLELTYPDNKNSDDIIKLNIGGVGFETLRSTLRRYPQSPLGHMFDKDLGMLPSIPTDKGYFFDEDPEIFHYMLNFLRYQTVPRLCRNDRDMLDKMTEEWLGVTLPLPLPPETKKHRFAPMQKQSRDGKLDWFLFDKTSDEIVGNSDFGAATKKEIKKLISEYNKRPIYSKFIYGWSGSGLAIYSLETGLRIGAHKTDWTKSPVDFIDEFLALHLIENGLSDNETHYFCTYNQEASFSAFNADNGQKILSGLKFQTLGACLNALRKRLKTPAVFTYSGAHIVSDK
jgi:hypothetical protein